MFGLCQMGIKLRTATLYLGQLRETELTIEFEDMGNGAGRTTCLECSGSSIWTFQPEPGECREICIPCKGSGKIYISV